MQPTPRHWEQSHLPTVLATLLVAAGLLTANLQRIDGVRSGNAWEVRTPCAFGWPVPYCEMTRYRTWPTLGTGKVQESTSKEIKYSGYLWIDRASALVLLIATAGAGELRRRSGQRWFQLSLRTLLALTGIAGCLLALHRYETSIYFWLMPEDGSIMFLFGCLTFRPWYIVAPIAVGVASLIYLVGWVIVQLLAACLGLVQSVVPGSRSSGN